MVVKILQHYAEGEITNFIKVWTLVFLSLTYTFFVSKAIPKGFPRLLTIIPVIILNLILPLSLHTIHLGASSAFFLVWLCNFKLLMLAFGVGPLSDPSISLPRFAAFASLPIKPHSSMPKQGLKSPWNYLAKALVISFLMKMYDYTDFIHTKLTWVLYSLHVYCGIELIMAFFGGLGRVLVGIDLEPQFNEPYLSSSLQEFWGRRWNIMVNRIMHPSVYDPVLALSVSVVGRRWAPLPAVMATFLVSGLMHEVIFFYFGAGRPRGELTLFFLIHGGCLAAEVAVMKVTKGRWRLPGFIARLLTVGFVVMTAFWLFFPALMRCDAISRGLGEYAAMVEFVKDVGFVFGFKSSHNHAIIV